ncbi:MAG: hypothetical protein GXP45_03700 [bacterium]|nr:hypothetical protein [bacterium]
MELDWKALDNLNWDDKEHGMLMVIKKYLQGDFSKNFPSQYRDFRKWFKK